MIGLLIQKVFVGAQWFVNMLNSNGKRGQSGGR